MAASCIVDIFAIPENKITITRILSFFHSQQRNQHHAFIVAFLSREINKLELEAHDP